MNDDKTKQLLLKARASSIRALAGIIRHAPSGAVIVAVGVPDGERLMTWAGTVPAGDPQDPAAWKQAAVDMLKSAPAELVPPDAWAGVYKVLTPFAGPGRMVVTFCAHGVVVDNIPKSPQVDALLEQEDAMPGGHAHAILTNAVTDNLEQIHALGNGGSIAIADDGDGHWVVAGWDKDSDWRGGLELFLRQFRRTFEDPQIGVVPLSKISEREPDGLYVVIVSPPAFTGAPVRLIFADVVPPPRESAATADTDPPPAEVAP